ncbi:argininosuccinate synthase-like [Oppia nitens]|uniref:argininosuccinate synthase-like n=1 Tax=Oppia nitens TaxID=1686743 RepID=UPI0023D9B6B9|nr:argininosuccinate synthase-like [Oppia nitens]
MSENQKKVVLAYSGGLDTTCILFWLKEQGYQVICYTADVGQEEDLDQVRQQALKLGAIKAIVDNRIEEFVTEFVYPSLAYGGIYQGRYLLGTSLCRPCISKGITRVANEEKAEFIAHGATGKGNDQIRFELSCISLDSNIKCITPWRMESFYNRFEGRLDLIEYAKSNGFKVTATPDKPYSTDANIMHISFESGVLEDPLHPPIDDMYLMTANPSQWPNEAEEIKITFSEGIPRLVENLNTKEKIDKPIDILKYLNKLGGKHGIGRIDIVEDRYIGMKSRGVYETPGGTIIWNAVRDLELLCLDREVNQIRTQLAEKFAEKVYYGLWYSPECHYIRACLKLSQKLVNGYVILQLFKGNAYIRGRKAIKSLYDQQLVSMDVQGQFTPNNADGFIKTSAIRLTAFNNVYKQSPYSS